MAHQGRSAPLLPPFPRVSALIDEGRRMSLYWADWLLGLVDRVNQTVEVIGTVAHEGHGAAIPLTTIPTRRLTHGLYRVIWTVRITQPATTSSSLMVTVQWTDGGVVCQHSGAALTGNTTATVQSGEAITHIDDGSVLQYSTAYASVGATPMQYTLVVRVEALP